MKEMNRDLGVDCLMEEKRKTINENEISSLLSPDMYRVVQKLGRREVVHDYADVLAHGVEGVLRWCSLAVVLSERERSTLRRVLLTLGGLHQTRQMMRLVPGREPALSDVPETKWTLCGEELFRKVFLAELRARQEVGMVVA